MITSTNLPIMNSENFKSVYGSLKFAIRERKLAAVLGDAGSGKTTILKVLAKENSHNHYILCSPNTTMKSMLHSIANAIGVDITGSNDKLQDQLTNALKDDPYHCIMLDECEYLHRGNVSKIDVIRQIYDQTNVPFILSGTYKLKNALVGGSLNEHEQPQIFRRLLKSEFGVVNKEETLSYLALLEKTYAVNFSQDAKTELFALCRDRGNGGFGIFIAMLEMIFAIVRPEWRDITNQINYQENLKIKQEKLKNKDTSSIDEADESQNELDEKDDDNAEPKGTDGQPLKFIDISKLKPVLIDRKMLRDVSKFKMTK